MKILIVDDSRTIRAGIARLVEKMGYTVVQASDGAEARVSGFSKHVQATPRWPRRGVGLRLE